MLQGRSSALSWPRQELPASQLGVNGIYYLSYYHREGKLTNPLGEWTHPTHQHWFWYHDITTHNVYFHHEDVEPWVVYAPVDPPQSGQYHTRQNNLWYDTDTREPRQSIPSG
jgi:hypothetical protein